MALIGSFKSKFRTSRVIDQDGKRFEVWIARLAPSSHAAASIVADIFS